MYHFAVSTKRLPAKVVAKRDAIARRIGGDGASFIQIREAAGGYKSWATVVNRGEPFNSKAQREIEAAWREAGV